MHEVTDPTGPEATSQPDRRGVIRAAGVLGVAVVGTATLAACGSGGSSDNGPGSPAGGPGGSATGIPTSEVPVGGGVVVPADQVVVTQPTPGTYKAFDVTCPHAGCAVSMVTDQGIICPCHGSVFDPATGQRRSGPAQTGLTPRTVTVTGNELTVS